MPTTSAKNELYRLGLILAAPSVATQQILIRYRGSEVLSLSPDYGPGRLFKRHHMLGGVLLLDDGNMQTQICASLKTSPKRNVTPESIYRVASIAKLTTSLCLLRLCESGMLHLNDRLFDILPASLPATHPLRKATLAQVLSHTSALRDTPAYAEALAQGKSYDTILQSEGAYAGIPGDSFAYCNFGFGLLGSVIETVTGECMESVFHREVFLPLEMNATLDVTRVDTEKSLTISRVLPYQPSKAWKAAEVAKHTNPLDAPDPARRFGITAGSLYTDAISLNRLLSMLSQGGVWNGKSYLSSSSVADMCAPHAAYGELSPTLSYGLGILIIQDPQLSAHRLLGHQGFAYGCADGAFFEETTGRRLVLLNGGASEARVGRLGRFNRDILRWALKEGNDIWS